MSSSRTSNPSNASSTPLTNSNMFLLILTILETFLATLETRTLQSDFTMSVTEQVSQPTNYTGSITMQGDRFLLSMFDLEAAYDGRTLYMYAADVDELTLSTPSERDILLTNPFLYARSLYNICDVSERKSKSGEVDVITLRPRQQGTGIEQLDLRLRDNLPVSIEIREPKRSTVLRLTNARYTDETITYTLHHDGAYINDLR